MEGTVDKSCRVVLNISGQIYETTTQTLERFPGTLLGDRQKRCLHYCEKSRQYFFDRGRVYFDAILFFYQSNGMLRCPNEVPSDLFEEGCKYFQIPKEEIAKLRKDEINYDFQDGKIKFDKETNRTWRFKLWNIMENPETTKHARWFGTFAITMILISAAAFSLETLPILQFKNKKFEQNPWAIIELVLQSWFLIEVIMGIISTTSRIEFFQSSVKWFDMLSVVPYFISFVICREKIVKLGFLRIIRCTRVVRLFPISERSIRLHKISGIIRSSMEEFKTLLLCLTIAVILGGSFMYYLETNLDGSHFHSIPHGLWWGIQTITTLGYGDIHPSSVGGKFFAAAYMIFGALFISLPVLTIVNKISYTYEERVKYYDLSADTTEETSEEHDMFEPVFVKNICTAEL